MKKIIVAGISYILLSAFFRPDIKATLVQEDDKNVIDTTVVVFLLDGKEVSSRWVGEKYQKNEIKVYGTHEPKKAVMWFGEKYRNGLFICEPIKEEKIENDE